MLRMIVVRATVAMLAWWSAAFVWTLDRWQSDDPYRRASILATDYERLRAAWIGYHSLFTSRTSAAAKKRLAWIYLAMLRCQTLLAKEYRTVTMMERFGLPHDPCMGCAPENLVPLFAEGLAERYIPKHDFDVSFAALAGGDGGKQL